MKEFAISHVSDSLNDSNDYLMRMWSVMLNKSRIGWLYQPFKSSSIIYVGNMSIHGLGDYSVKIKSKTRNTISGLIFRRLDGNNITESEKVYFENLQVEIDKIEKKAFIYAVKMKIDSQFGVKYIHPFQLQDFSIYCINEKQFIEFTVYAYSEGHAKELFNIKARSIADLLSIQINSHIKLEGFSLRSKRVNLSNQIENKKQLNEDWIDDYPIENDHFILPDYSKQKFLDVVNGSKNLDVLLKSSHHFCNALGLSYQNVHEDLIVSQIMSSIEVITEINSYPIEQCKECGQLKFSIRNRVLDLIEHEMADHMRIIFSDFYETRSKYLHAGRIRSTRVYTGVCLPQISDNTKSGCLDYPTKFELNLIEWVGWLLRKIMRERF